jgi:hypothetical protein
MIRSSNLSFFPHRIGSIEPAGKICNIWKKVTKCFGYLFQTCDLCCFGIHGVLKLDSACVNSLVLLQEVHIVSFTRCSFCVPGYFFHLLLYVLFVFALFFALISYLCSW